MSGYILGDDAVLDLEAIWDYIARAESTLRTAGSRNFLKRLRRSDRIRAWVINVKTSPGFPFSSGLSAYTSLSTGRRAVRLRLSQ